MASRSIGTPDRHKIDSIKTKSDQLRSESDTFASLSDQLAAKFPSEDLPPAERKDARPKVSHTPTPTLRTPLLSPALAGSAQDRLAEKKRLREEAIFEKRRKTAIKNYIEAKDKLTDKIHEKISLKKLVACDAALTTVEEFKLGRFTRAEAGLTSRSPLIQQDFVMAEERIFLKQTKTHYDFLSKKDWPTCIREADKALQDVRRNKTPSKHASLISTLENAIKDAQTCFDIYDKYQSPIPGKPRSVTPEAYKVQCRAELVIFHEELAKAKTIVTSRTPVSAPPILPAPVIREEKAVVTEDPKVVTEDPELARFMATSDTEMLEDQINYSLARAQQDEKEFSQVVATHTRINHLMGRVLMGEAIEDALKEITELNASASGAPVPSSSENSSALSTPEPGRTDYHSTDKLSAARAKMDEVKATLQEDIRVSIGTAPDDLKEMEERAKLLAKEADIFKKPPPQPTQSCWSRLFCCCKPKSTPSSHPESSLGRSNRPGHS